MTSQKFLLIFTGSLLTVAAILGVMRPNASNSASPKILSYLSSTNPMMLVEEGQESILVTLPSQKQNNELNAMFGQNPKLLEDAKNVRRKKHLLKVTGLDKQQKQSSKAYTLLEVKFKDAASGEEHVLDLISYEGEKGRRVVAEPQTATPLLVANPTDPSQGLFEKNNGLYILDMKTLQVKPIGDHKARYATYLRKNALPPIDDYERTLIWSQEPTWSPDGSTIAFLSNRDRVETNRPDVMSLWIHDVATGQESKLYEKESHPQLPVGWTPDGRILITEFNRAEERFALVTIDPKTKQRQELATGNFVAQSDDRQTVLYTQKIGQNGRSTELYALSLTTGTSQLLYKTSESEVVSSHTADFSADGARIVTDLQNRQNGVQTLFVYNLQTQQGTRLTLPQGKQLSADVKWVGNELVVPVENLNLQNLTSETLLMSAQ